MKNFFRNLIYLIFLITLSVISYEIFNVAKFRLSIEKGKTGLSESSHTNTLANEDLSTWIESQNSASKARIYDVSVDFLKNLLFAFIALLFLNRSLQSNALKFADKKISFIKSEFRQLKKNEINYMCLLYVSYLFVILIVGILGAKDINMKGIARYLALSALFYLLILPFSLFIVYLLLSKFKKKFIVICYIAYMLKVLPEIIIQDDVDLEKMQPVDIQEFPANIQQVLSQYDLTNKVYKEILPGEDVNAALIGYGSKKRMEIYGNYTTFSPDQLYSVLLHEVGHAEENSLLRKTLLYFVLIVFEAAIVLFIYDYLGDKFVNEDVSFFTAFVVLVFIYRLGIRQWVFCMYKIGSQASEIHSDLFAREYSYGESLAQTLFNIGVQSKDYIATSKVYNSLRSGHPSIYSRIEYLNS